MIFIISVLCQFVAVLVILFAHGAFQNFQKQSQSGVFFNSSDIQYDIGFGNITNQEVIKTDSGVNTIYDYDGGLYLYDLFKAMNAMDKETKKGFTGCANVYEITDAGYEWILVVNMEYLESYDAYGYYQVALDNMGKDLSSGRMLTQEDFVTGAYVAVMSPQRADQLGLDVGDTFTFLGNSYELVGTYDFAEPFIDVPPATLPNLYDDNACVTINMNGVMMTTKTYNGIQAAFRSVFGDYVKFPPIPTVEESEVQYYRTVMLISLLIAAVSAIDLAVLYKFILNTRRKQLAVFRITGCTKSRARRIYLSEILLFSLMSFAGAAAVYHFAVLPRLTKIFEFIADAYEPKTYLILGGIYLAAVYGILNAMIFFHIRKTPVELLRGRDKT
ncbi:MAG: ABC transporter permease [Oscillospiraceae bacterium]